MRQKTDLLILSTNIMGKRIYLEIGAHKLRKLINYFVFGFLTTMINILVFSLCVRVGIHYLAGNIVAFIVAIIFAYTTNKRWVFAASDSDKMSFNEFMRFVGSRISTLLLESAILFLFITLMGLNQYGVKITANIVVVFANYFLSEFYVFRKEKTPKGV